MERSTGNPLALFADEFLEALYHFLAVEFSESKLSVRDVHALEVLVWTEEQGAVIMSDICLETLEAFDAVMEGRVGRVELKWLVSLNQRSLPSTVVHVIVNFEHVVS